MKPLKFKKTLRYLIVVLSLWFLVPSPVISIDLHFQAELPGKETPKSYYLDLNVNQSLFGNTECTLPEY